VLLSGLFWRGRPHALLEQVRAGTLTLISSPALLAELAEVMNRPTFQAILVRSNTDPEQTLGELRRLAEIIDPPPPTPVSRDPSDDEVLALAAGSQADLIISGDADLPTLGSHAGIPIIDPAEALTRISGWARQVKAVGQIIEFESRAVSIPNCSAAPTFSWTPTMAATSTATARRPRPSRRASSCGRR
jgi:uncharacterized protein